MDLAYAPPYSSAKDPVNMAGFVIENVRSGLVKQFSWKDLEELQQNQDTVFLDVRTPAEYQRGHFKGAVNIPVDELRDHLDQLDPGKTIYVNCHSGLRSYLACRILSGNGFDCRNFSGGYRFYEHILNDREFDAVPRHACGEVI